MAKRILRAGFRLLFRRRLADIQFVKRLVAVVICSLVVPAAAPATVGTDGQLRSAARLSGLPVRKAVPRATLSAARYGVVLSRAGNRITRRHCATPTRGSTRDSVCRASSCGKVLHVRPVPRGTTPTLTSCCCSASRSRTRAHRARARARARRSELQPATPARTACARSRPALAAHAIVDGTAALVSKLRPPTLSGTAANRFVALESAAGLVPVVRWQPSSVTSEEAKRCAPRCKDFLRRPSSCCTSTSSSSANAHSRCVCLCASASCGS